MSETSAQEKEYEATPRKLEEARRKGEVPKSRDLLAAAGFAGLILAWLVIGATGPARLAEPGVILIDQAESLSSLVFSGARVPVGGLIGSVAVALAPMFLIPMLAVIAMLVVQRGLVFAPSKLEPKLSRISPLQGARNKFGRKGLFEFAKNLVKMLIVSGALFVFLSMRSETLLNALYFPPALVSALLLRLAMEFLLIVLVMQVVIGAADLAWEHAEHLRQNRMTRKEMMDELKQSEGDPHLKAERRQRAVDVATNRMLSDVARADVVIVNPTHYAVALRWNRSTRQAPVCVAKGVDTVAARIRERAAEAGVPIRHDPPTARALHAALRIGEEIHPDHYKAVAAAIRFAEAIRRKIRARGDWRAR